jgi:hypothetical protein
MAITPFGAVFDNNIPSPMESYVYFNTLKQKQEDKKLQQKILDAKAAQEADENYQKAIKPLTEFKVNTGYADPRPDLVLTEKVKSIQQQAADMYKNKKSTAEVGQFIQNSLLDLNNQHNWYKNARETYDQQLATIKPTDGLDVNKLRELGTLEMLYTDDGKGGKRFRQPNETMDVNNLVTKVLSKHADKINVNNKAALFNMPEDSDYSEDLKKLLTGDGRVVYGNASGRYNKLYQEVKQLPNHDVAVTTRAVPAERNGEVITGKDGKPVMILPQEAYIDFISNPGRMVEVEKEVKKQIAQEKQELEYEATRKAGKELDLIYGSKLKEMPAAQRLALQKKTKQDFLTAADEPDEELIRQRAAYQLADKYIAKRGIKRNEIRDPSIRHTTVVNMKEKEEPVINNVFDKISDIAKDRKGGRIELNELGPTENEIIMGYIHKAEKKQSFGKTDDYMASEVSISVDDGGDMSIIRNSDGKRLMKLDRVAVNRKANSGSQKVVEQVLKDDKNSNTKSTQPKGGSSGIKWQ